MMVNKENMRAWIAALRSGEYRQGKYALAAREPDGTTRYCCLGVACEISGVVEPDNPADHLVHYNGNATTLPPKVQDWLGVDYGDVEVIGSSFWYDTQDLVKVSILNDNREFSFDQIADALERTYLRSQS